MINHQGSQCRNVLTDSWSHLDTMFFQADNLSSQCSQTKQRHTGVMDLWRIVSGRRPVSVPELDLL